MGKKTPLKNMTLRPKNLEKARDDFINEPDRKKKQKTPNFEQNEEKWPWNEGEVSDRVQKPIIIRLNEVDQAKLNYILSKTIHKSKHSFCIDLIREGIELALEGLD